MSAPEANKVVGDDAFLQVGTDSTAMTIVGAFDEITPNQITAPNVETTKLGDPAETRQGGRPDFGEVSFKLRFNASMNIPITTYMINRTPLFARVVVKDTNAAGSTLNSNTLLQCFFSKFQPIGPLTHNKEVVGDATLVISGTASFTAGT